MSAQNVVINIRGDAEGLRRSAQTGVQALSSLNAQIARASQLAASGAASTIQLRNATGQYTTVVKQARNAADLLIREQAEMLAIHKQLEQSLTKQQLSVLRSTGAMSSFRGATGSADFALLSLTQGLQDAGQFGVGMAQGIRAVNNNLQQFVTAVVFSVQQAGSLRTALGSMLKAMIGPAGILFAFSAVSAAIEFFSNRAQSAASKAKKLREEADRFIKVASGAVDIDTGLRKYDVDAQTATQATVFLTETVRSLREQTQELINTNATSSNTTALQIAQIEENQRLIERLSKSRDTLLEVTRDAQTEMAAENILRQAGLGYLIDEIRNRERLKEIYDKTTAGIKREKNALDQFIESMKEVQRQLALHFRDTDGGLVTMVTDASRRVEAAGRNRLQRGLRGEGDPIGQDMLRQLGDGTLSEADRVRQGLEGMSQSFYQKTLAWANNNAQGIQQSGALISSVIGGLGSSFMSLAQQGDSSNRGMFAAGKAFAIAEATVNTAVAATKAYAQGGIFGPALAAGVIAAGMAQIAVIKRTQYGGGGGSASSGGSTRTFTAPGTAGNGFGTSGSLTLAPASVLQQQTPVGGGGFNGRFVIEGRDLVSVVSSEADFQARTGVRNPVFSR